MKLRPTPVRPGFTLLEVLLASAIAVLLLAGLYVAFDLTLSRTDVSREQAARADLVRAVVNRLNIDLTASLGPMPPKSGGGVASEIAATATASPTSTTPAAETGTETATSATTPTDATTTTDATTDPATDAAALAADVPFQAGVIGNDTQVTLFVSRVP
ncbi:MAG: PulJ/GspJ family protein, partial [Fimbriiglobus sp.]